MATKSFTEQVEEIKNSSASVASKKRALIRFGLTSYEADIILKDFNIKADSDAYTFGVEIECLVQRGAVTEKAREFSVPISYEGYNHRDNKHYFKFVSDASIRGENPIECVSPILSSKGGFEKLENCCKALNEAGAAVNKSTGLHVHIGAANLSGWQYCNVFINYQRLEKIIDTFMAASRRESNNMYCKTLLNQCLANCNDMYDVLDVFGRSRYYKVNPCSYMRHRTIEFRQHQGSTDFEKISMWVKFCAKLVKFSKNNRLQEDVSSINDIPFLTQKEKAFFNKRANHFANN